MVAFVAMIRSLTVALLASFALGCGAEGEEPKATVDSGAKQDATADTRRPDGSAETTVSDSESPDAPPPIEDTSGVEDFGVPPAGSRVEGTIGAAGGSIEGAPATPLAGVKLVVPAGALSSDVLFAIDLVGVPTGPGGAKLISPYVRVGPEGVAFAIPARLTLPYSTTTPSPQIAPVARIGLNWSSLQDPSGDDKTVTASMRRTSGAALALLDLSSTMPKITAATPSGSTLFIDGTGFGVAQVFRPGDDGGAPFVSSITYGGVVAETLAWSESSISIRIPATDAGTTVNVTTPGGSSSL
jgi:hypothetical protein